MKGKRSDARLWNTNLEDFVRFQQRVLARMSQYFGEVSQLAGTGLVEPGEWIRDYARFWGALVGDAGDWARESPTRRRGPRHREGWPHLFRGRVHRREGAYLPFAIPREAFPDDDPETRFVLTTDGLVKRGGGEPVPKPEQNLRFDRDHVTLMDRSRKLKFFDLKGLVAPQEVYRGLVWMREEDKKMGDKKKDLLNLPVAAIEIEIV